MSEKVDHHSSHPVVRGDAPGAEQWQPRAGSKAQMAAQAEAVRSIERALAKFRARQFARSTDNREH